MIKTLRLLLTLSILLSCVFNTFSQRRFDPTPEDVKLAKSVKEQFPDASVAIIESKETVSFDFDKRSGKVTVEQMVTDKMINLDVRSDIKKYCFYDGESEINTFEIRYNNNRKTGFYVRDEAYTSNDLFHNDVRVKHIDVAFPILGYRYISNLEKDYKDVKYFTKIQFTDDYPILKKTIEIEVPEWLDIELKPFNFEGQDIEQKKKANPKDNVTVYTFVIKNLAGYPNVSNTPGPGYIFPHLLILPKSQSYNGTKTPIFETTQDLYNWYKHLVDELNNPNQNIKTKVAELTAGLSSDKDKIEALYYWVQDNIRYIAFEDGIAGFKPDEAENVLNKKYGDCKGMANLLKHMLTIAGYDARLTWLGTKRIPYDYSTPNLSVDNHMICTLFLNGETIFLDGTEKYGAYGEYANRLQGKQVLIEDGEKYILKTVPKAKADFNTTTTKYTLRIDGNSLTGKALTNFTGESRSGLLYLYNNQKNDKKESFFKDYFNIGNQVEASNFVTSNLDDRNTDLTVDYDITANNNVSEFDGTVYLDLDFDKELRDFNLKDRTVDYVFNHKKALNATTELILPDGYSIGHLPKGVSVKNDDFELSASFTSQNGKLIYRKVFKIKNETLKTERFDEWNEAINALKQFYHEQITLTKN